jgi:hypothetical protein
LHDDFGWNLSLESGKERFVKRWEPGEGESADFFRSDQEDRRQGGTNP